MCDIWLALFIICLAFAGGVIVGGVLAHAD